MARSYSPNEVNHTRGVGSETDREGMGKEGGETMPTGEEVVTPMVDK